MIIDLKTKRIPNSLCLFGIITGLFFSYASGRESMLLEGIKGILIAFVLLIGIYAVNAIGAGDVKLMCAIGAFVGRKIVNIICYSMVSGAIVGIMAFIRHKKIFGLRICFGVPIFMGVVWYFLKGGFLEL